MDKEKATAALFDYAIQRGDQWRDAAQQAEAKLARVEAALTDWEASVPGQNSLEEEVAGETISQVVADLRAALEGSDVPPAE